jgi:hypothetical protein
MAERGEYHRLMPGDYRKIFADNVKRLMESDPRVNSGAKLARRTVKPSDGTRVSARTINRIKSGEEIWPQLDTMIAIADSLRVPLWCLFLSGLDPKHPPGPQIPDATSMQLAQRIVSLSPNARDEVSRLFSGNPEETSSFVARQPASLPSDKTRTR